MPRLSLILLLILILSSCHFDNNRQQGFLYLRLSANPTTLDPALIVDVTGGSIGAKIFNGLVRFDENLNVIPDIAERWNASKDGRSYTFHLKRGVRFSNGREVRASDFKYSFERVLNTKTKSPNTWVFERISGAKAYMEGRATDVKGIKVVGDYILKIHIDKPFAPFIELLAMISAYVVPREVVERLGPDFAAHPIGTGPFSLKQWHQNQSLVLLARQDYFGGHPKIKGIVYRIIPEDLTAVAEFENGNLDLLSIPSSEFKRYTGDRKWKGLITSYVAPNTYYLGLNCERPPFNKLLLRRAMNYAIDVDRILNTIYEGRGIRALGPVPPQLRKWTLSKRYNYNPEKARELIKEAGYSNGLSIKIYLTSDQEVLDILEVIQAYLKDVGIKAELIQLEWSAYKEAINRGEADAFYLSWWADYPDAEDFLYPLFHSSNIGPAGNRARFSDPEVDRLIESGQAAMIPKDRWYYYQKAEQRIVDMSPWVFFWHRRDYVIRQPWVKGYRIHPIYSMDKGMEVSF